jgi:hypothetical protein
MEIHHHDIHLSIDFYFQMNVHFSVHPALKLGLPLSKQESLFFTSKSPTLRSGIYQSNARIYIIFLIVVLYFDINRIFFYNIPIECISLNTPFYLLS